MKDLNGTTPCSSCKHLLYQHHGECLACDCKAFTTLENPETPFPLPWPKVPEEKR